MTPPSDLLLAPHEAPVTHDDDPLCAPTVARRTDRFELLVELLRQDFRRLFPQLVPVESECFHVHQGEGDSGRVWTEYTELRDGRRFRCRITLYVEGGQVARRSRQEWPVGEHLEDTAPPEPGSKTRGDRPAVSG